MIRQSLFIGASAIALVATASTAQAQNTQSGTCSPTTQSGTSTAGGNNCTLTRGPAADSDNSTINVTGTGNTVTVTQNGLFDTSTVNINGNSNTVSHTQNGNFDEATSQVIGNQNTSLISQDGSRMRAVVTLTGNRNSSSVEQGLAGVAAAGGTSNTASVTSSGNNIQSRVVQNSGAVTSSNNTAVLNLATDAGAAALGTFNQDVLVTQRANGNTANVVVRGGGSATATSQNSVTVTQENTRFRQNAAGVFNANAAGPNATNNPSTGNIADLSVVGLGQLVTVEQDGVQNFASASVQRGGANATTVAGSVDGLAFPGGRREGNQLTVLQDGQNNRSNVSIGGRDAAGFNGRGNIARVEQGQGTAVPFAGGTETNPAATPTGAAQASTAAGTGHSATLFQFGTLSQVTVRQDNNASNTGTGVNAGGVQSASTADISQSAFASTITLNQLGTNSATISQGGNVPGGAANTLSGNNTFSASQIDAGDSAAPGSTDPFAGAGTFIPQQNSLNAVQAGRFNNATVRQNGTNVSATVFQSVGSSSATLELNQGANTGFGTGVGGAAGAAVGTGGNMTADIEQGGVQTAGGVRVVRTLVRQDGVNLDVRIRQNSGSRTATGTDIGVSQVGTFNSATVSQTGNNAVATVDQRGNGTADRRNQVTITQSGGTFANAATGVGATGNRAIVRQATGVGASPSTAGTATTADEFGGSRGGAQASVAIITQSAEGTLLAADTFNSATIEQNGLGQYAEISQAGRNNQAAIRQGAAATNAVGIIRQTGNNNSFALTQDSPNQFFRVVQTGNSNQVTTGSGTNSGATTTTSGAGFTFVPVAGPTAAGGF